MSPSTNSFAVGLFLIVCTSAAFAQEVPAGPTAAPKPQAEGDEGKPEAAMPCKCPTPPVPLYVEDWGRLAALTRSDSVVFEKAELWRNRHESCSWLLVAALVGGGVAALSTVNRLTTGDWTETNERGLAGGIALAAVSTLAWLAFSPDRDDRLTVINQWNLRHPDRPLAP